MEQTVMAVVRPGSKHPKHFGFCGLFAVCRSFIKTGPTAAAQMSEYTEQGGLCVVII